SERCRSLGATSSELNADKVQKSHLGRVQLRSPPRAHDIYDMYVTFDILRIYIFFVHCTTRLKYNDGQPNFEQLDFWRLYKPN
ncbi:MAG: hypothetical protein NC184_05925, partial [Roseburia sp.]|nr:hypothetical protein [Roseburia sp.]